MVEIEGKERVRSLHALTNKSSPAYIKFPQRNITTPRALQFAYMHTQVNYLLPSVGKKGMNFIHFPFSLWLGYQSFKSHIYSLIYFEGVQPIYTCRKICWMFYIVWSIDEGWSDFVWDGCLMTTLFNIVNYQFSVYRWDRLQVFERNSRKMWKHGLQY